MTIQPTTIPDVFVLEPKIFEDSRGFFFESYNERELSSSRIATRFVQDNHSQSHLHTLRGLHYQVNHPQGKLIRVIRGEAFDVAVDLRRASPTFKRWVGVTLSEANKKQLWIPPGFAHGFLALKESVELLYKTTDFYSPADERTIIWNDPDLAIEWPLLCGIPILSKKDASGSLLKHAQLFD